MSQSDGTQPTTPAAPHLPGTVVECHDMIRQLQLSHAQVMQRLSELEERLKLNSRNSSKPPSSDGPIRHQVFELPRIEPLITEYVRLRGVPPTSE